MTWTEAETKGGRGIDLNASIQQNFTSLSFYVGGKQFKDIFKVKLLEQTENASH